MNQKNILYFDNSVKISNTTTIAAMDLGLKRIGLALCIRGIVLPQEPVQRRNRAQAAADVSAFLARSGAQILAVGLPAGGAAEAEFRRRIAHFCSLLDFRGPVALVDESFSSREAAEQVRSRRAGAKTGRQDSAAAAVILQRFLSSVNFCEPVDASKQPADASKQPAEQPASECANG